MSIQLITFDLDDTLWDTAPVIVSAEAILRAWLTEHAPNLGAVRWNFVGLRERSWHRRTSSTASAPCAAVLFQALKKPVTPTQASTWPTRASKCFTHAQLKFSPR